MKSENRLFSSARTMLDALSSNRISASELLEACIEQHESVNPAINAVVRFDFEAARATAARLDKMAASGKRVGPLHGLPMTVKDTFDVEGMPATAGAPEYMRRNPNSPDADVVARLRAAGAVIWGKTNTPYLAGDNQTYNELHGRTNNPWDLTRTPGGSSGGAAAALAVGVTPLELGSDIGGSLRLPAHFCGIAALKPSYGRVPIRGHVPPAPGSVSVRDLNVAGPMARSAGDLSLLFDVISDARPSKPRRTGMKSRRFALWVDEPGFPLSAACAAAVEAAAEAAEETGASVSEARPPVTGANLLDLYLQLLLPILATDMPEPLVRAMEMGRPFTRLLANREPYSRAKWAAYSAATHHDWLKANEVRERLKRSLEGFFDKWDAIICPVAPSSAFEHIERGDSVTRKLEVDGQPTPYHSFHSWIALATVCHLPAAVIPVPGRAGELPSGVQIIGREGSDLDVLAIAEALEKELGGFRAPPKEALLAPLPAPSKYVSVKKVAGKKPAPKKAPKMKPDKKSAGSAGPK